MIKVIAGATVAASFLSALGYVVAIGAASAVTYIAITKMFDKMKEITGLKDEGNGKIPINVPETIVSRAGEAIIGGATNIAGELGFNVGHQYSWNNPCDVNSPAYSPAQCRKDSLARGDAVMSAAPKEENRMAILLNFIDYVSFWD